MGASCDRWLQAKSNCRKKGLVAVDYSRKTVLCWGLAPILALIVLSRTAEGQGHREMMRATFKVVGDSAKVASGEEAAAAFAIDLSAGKPATAGPDVALITAGHFFDNIKGKRIYLQARRRTADGEFEKLRHPIDLQVQKPLRHPDKKIDAAVIRLDWPAEYDNAALPLDRLATTNTLRPAFRPGRQVFTLGYPFAIEGDEAGFPILRRAIIASFAAPPANGQPSFLLDMNMSQGFSGSPVYTVTGGGAGRRPTLLILGMVVGQHELTSEFKGPMESRKVHYPLDLGIAVPAPALREMLEKKMMNAE